MSSVKVNIVTAFGRGESLALALAANHFDVRVIDFTSAFGPEWQRGAGPFPILAKEFIPSQRAVISDLRTLPRGLTFWLKDGPLELSGSMSDFFAETKESVRKLKSGKSSDEFDEAWLSRFLERWVSPYHAESWEAGSSENKFPYAQDMGLVPYTQEARLLSFERYLTLEHSLTEAASIREIKVANQRLEEVTIETKNGQTETLDDAQWVWCLSSEETIRLGGKMPVSEPEWRWLGFQGRAARGPWTAGFPQYTLVVGDIHLPWSYTNSFILRWIETDVFHAWVQVPAAASFRADRRAEWAADLERALMSRLNLAQWKINGEQWWICPHSVVFSARERDRKPPQWKNWEWISPETLPRLDLSTRLEREALTFQKLLAWRNEPTKKQGGRGDHALHAP